MEPKVASPAQETPAVAATEAAPPPEAAAPAKPGFIKALLERRIPQIAGVYIGVVWSVFQFVRWLINRFVLSPHLEDVFMLTALLLAPTVLALAYFHGGRGRHGWTRGEKIFIPCNVILAVVVLYLVFGGKDLGSAQETVTVVDATGNETEHVIPKSEFRKRLAIFYFDNQTGDADLDWARYGLAGGLMSDLLQDQFITAMPAFEFPESLKRAGFADGFGAPLALQLKIAEERRLDYVLNGTLKKNGDAYVLDTKLYRTENGKLIAEQSFENATLPGLVDAASLQLRHDLDIPKKHIEETADLPVSEVTTSSLSAMRTLADGMQLLFFAKEHEQGAALLEQAVAEDPTFAFAHLMRGNLFVHQQRFDAAIAAYRTGQQHDYRLPERTRLSLTTKIFFLDKKPEEALQAALQWRTLYPDDPEAYEFLVNHHVMHNQIDEAIAVQRQLLVLDPAETNRLLYLGDILRNAQRHDEAIETYQRYVDRLPNRAAGYQRLGWVYSHTGEIDKKLAVLKKAMIAEPSDPNLVENVASTLFQLGDFDEAYQHYRRAIAQSRTDVEKAGAYGNLAYYYEARGQFDLSFAMRDTSWTHLAAYSLDNVVLQAKATQAADLARAGRVAQARQFIEQARAHPATTAEGFYGLNIDLHESALLVEMDQPEEALAMLDGTREEIVAFGVLNEAPAVDLFRGRAYQHLGQYAEAITAIETYLKAYPSDVSGWTLLGQVHHQSDRPDEATLHFQHALKLFPSFPEAHLGLAKVLKDQNRLDEARTHLDHALAAWAEADATFAPAQEARQLLETLP